MNNGYISAFVYLSVTTITEKLSTNIAEMFGVGGRVISNRRLACGGDPDHDPDTGIFNGIFSP